MTVERKTRTHIVQDIAIWGVCAGHSYVYSLLVRALFPHHCPFPVSGPSSLTHEPHQVFEDSFHQLRMRNAEELRGRLQVPLDYLAPVYAPI